MLRASILLLALTGAARAQVTPDMIPPAFGKPAEGAIPSFLSPPKADPRLRRAEREKAAAKVPAARAMIESGAGDAAVACILSLPPEAGEKLAARWEAIRKLPSPGDFFLYLSRIDKEVTLFALERLDELRDPDAFTGFLTDGLEISLGLKTIQQSASEARARRLYAQAQPQQTNWAAYFQNLDLKALGIGAGAAVALLAVLRRLGRRNPTP